MRRRRELEARVARLEAQVNDLAGWVATLSQRDGEESAGEAELVWKDAGEFVLVEPVAEEAASDG